MAMVLVNSLPSSPADFGTGTRVTELVRENHICGEWRVKLRVPEESSTARRGLDGIIRFDHGDCFGQEPKPIFSWDCGGLRCQAVDVGQNVKFADTLTDSHLSEELERDIRIARSEVGILDVS
jgi:hypothetical protein